MMFTSPELLAHQEGFEPPTNGFVVRYSIQLSYWCKTQAIIPDPAAEYKSFVSFLPGRRQGR